MPKPLYIHKIVAVAPDPKYWKDEWMEMTGYLLSGDIVFMQSAWEWIVYKHCINMCLLRLEFGY